MFSLAGLHIHITLVTHAYVKLGKLKYSQHIYQQVLYHIWVQ